MKRVLTAVVLIPIVLLIVFRGPMWLFIAFIGAVALLASWEYLEATKHYFGTPLRAVTLGSIFILYAVPALAANVDIQGFILLLALLAPFVLLAVAMRKADLREGFLAASISFFAIPYIGFSLATLVFLRGYGWLYVLFVLVVVWVGDTAAYYVGRGIGRHLMAPRISPKKTWEGAVGSVLGSVLAACALVHWARPMDQWLGMWHLLSPPYVHVFPSTDLYTIGTAVVVNIAAQIGDLVESLIKRGANIKDSGSLLPGHGGILDRIDALLFAAPIAFLIVEASIIAAYK